MTAQVTTATEEVRPPVTETGFVGWVWENLLSPWYNLLLTVVSLAIMAGVLIPMFRWFTTPVDLDGPRWGVIEANVQLFSIGQYPLEQAWRVWVAIYIIAFLVGAAAAMAPGVMRVTMWVGVGMSVFLTILPAFVANAEGEPVYSSTTSMFVFGTAIAALVGWGLLNTVPSLGRFVAPAFFINFVVTWVLIRGVGETGPLPLVEPSKWGGLLLTLILAIAGIVAAFPLGVALALGRRSDLPVVKYFCTIYIEVIRGVPLVTVLFFAQIMLPLFLPEALRPERVLRAGVGIVMFAAAYLAENVRGGLQAIPRGQYEAADALGLSGFQSMRLIIMPQALRIVIPALVGQFIGLFKDTSLVAIIGLFDLFQIGRSVLAQPDWLGTQREVYLFVALVYWIFSYTMAYSSRQLEKELGVGER